MNQYLALDLGGTKTHIALFTLSSHGQLTVLKEKKYPTQEANNLEEILLDFHPKMDVEFISIALAGPVIGDEAQLTNVKWKVDKHQIIEATGVSAVYLLNDLESSAYAIPFLEESDLNRIYKGERNLPGNAAIIAPGTGLGEAAMYWDGKEYHPFATEGGHTDFSPHDSTDIVLLMYLQHKYGHVSWERVASGMGICNIFDFLRTSSKYHLDAEKEAELLEGDVAANISKAAVEGEPIAVHVMRLFVKYLAVEASNLVLTIKATGGLYICGGIVPKIWNEKYQELFLEYFFGVGRLEPLMRCVDVSIVLSPTSALFGAAYFGIKQVKAEG